LDLCCQKVRLLF